MTLTIAPCVWCDEDVAVSADELEDYAVHLAAGAADVVRGADPRSGGSQRDLDVQAKSTASDLVTVVDRMSERWLIEQIARDRPGDALLGEEGGPREGTTGVRWLLDPIDGTVNFVLGLPQYAISVAAQLDGRVVAGAVCNPVSGELFHARQGGGAWLGEQALSGPREVELSRAVIGTGFGYDRELRRRQAAVAAALLPRIADLRRLGSAALDLCALAAGRLDGYFEAGLNPWDYGAGALIATEAGCVVSGLHGDAVSSRITVGAGVALAPELVAVLEELGADRVAD
jgi:myo-inositol-1(or 4)-monophosphatase